MKRLFFLFFAIIFLFFPLRAFADEGWVIKNYKSDLVIKSDGKVQITEKIDLDFKNLSKHGIYRDIPYVYSDGQNNIYTEINIISVMQDNSSATYTDYRNGNYLRLKIGDANKTITGKHSYEISYLAAGILKNFGDQDELYWNVTGDQWPVQILKTEATVSLEKGNLNRVTCFQGSYGSKETCEASIAENNASFFATRAFGVGENMTIVAGYPKGVIPILVVTPRPVPKSKSFSPGGILPILAFLATLIVSIFISFLVWFKHGRDFWWRNTPILQKAGKEEIMPIGAHETVVVEYTPPENLRPAELGTLVDERADTLDVTATIIDLAARGFLTIAEIQKKWMFGSTDYELAKREKDTSKLLVYEKELLDRIFEEENIIPVSYLKKKFYEDLRNVKEKLYQDVVDKKIFAQSPEKVRTKYLLISFALFFVAGGIIFAGFSLFNTILIAIGTGLIFSRAVALMLSRKMPRRTAYGRELYRRARGYELFISRVEKYRQQFFERKNMFNEILPYAIVFGLTEKFAKALKDMGVKPVSPTWYHSATAFNIASFSSSVNKFSNSFSSAIAASPKSSGFSSGGSSGGGFGGGGGGSW